MVRILMFFLRLSKKFLRLCSTITSTKSPSFSKITFSASLIHLTVLLQQSHNYSYYISRWIPAHPPLRLLKLTDLRTHHFPPCFDLWRQPRLVDVTCAWSWGVCGINSAISYTWLWLFSSTSFSVHHLPSSSVSSVHWKGLV